MLRHSRTGMAEQMAQALHSGAKQAALEMEASSGLVIDILRANEVQVGWVKSFKGSNESTVVAQF